jgi:hypothetical protein
MIWCYRRSNPSSNNLTTCLPLSGVRACDGYVEDHYGDGV